MRTYIKIGIILLGFIAQNLFADDQKPLYRVVEAKGDTQLRPFLSASWRPIESGILLYNDDMITVGVRSRLKLRKLMEKDSKEGASMISITQPFITRVSPRLIRQVKQSNVAKQLMAFRSIGESRSTGKIDNKANFDFRDAWTKFVSSDSRSKAKSENLKGSSHEEKSDSSGSILMSETAKPITVYAPRENEEIQTDSVPKSISLSWGKAEGYSGPYLLYIWQHGTPKPKVPIVETTLDFHRHSIAEVGRYDFQVTTGDNSWQSPISTFTISMADRNPVADQGGRASETFSIHLNFPPIDYVRISGKSLIEFSWTFPDGASIRSAAIELVRDGAQIESIPVDGTSRELEVSEGTLHWRLVATQKTASNSLAISSEWREIKIISLAPPRDHSILKSLIDAKVSGNIDIELK